MNVDRRSGLSYEAFHAEYLAPNRPVVLTDAIARWPALGKWSLDWFKTHYGDRRFVCRGESEAIRIDDYIDSLATSTFERPRPYMRNINVQPDFVELLPDLEPRIIYSSPDLLCSPLMPKDWLRPHDLHQLFISGTGTTIPLHYDDWKSCNVISNLCGVKRFTFFAPEDGRYLYPRSDNIILSEIVNIYDVDTERHPLFSRATPIEVDLGPGETLLVPSGWWHTSLTLESCISISSSFVSKHHWQAFSREMHRLYAQFSPLKAKLVYAYLRGVGVAHQLVDAGGRLTRRGAP